MFYIVDHQAVNVNANDSLFYHPLIFGHHHYRPVVFFDFLQNHQE